MDLCRPRDEKYNLAVSTAMGKTLDSIVVENTDVARACMEVLQPACQNRKHQPLLSLAALQEQRQPVYLDLWM